MAVPVTYSIVGKGMKEDSGMKTYIAQLTIGDGVGTYGTGISVDKGSLGCPNEIKALLVMNIIDGAAAHAIQYNPADGKLHLFDGAFAEIGAGVAPAAFSCYVEVKGW